MKVFRAEIEGQGKSNNFRSNTLEITVGMPCAQCNNGWMSNLESAVKPFMTDMVDRGKTVLLNEERQSALVDWMVKTAIVYEFSGSKNERKYISYGERRALKQSRAIPENLWIWVGRYDGVRPMHSLQLRASSETAVPEIYSITFSANFLVLQLFAARDPWFSQLAKATRGERLQQVYPHPGGWISWPPPVTIDDEALDFLDHRFRNVIDRATKRAQGKHIL